MGARTTGDAAEPDPSDPKLCGSALFSRSFGMPPVSPGTIAPPLMAPSDGRPPSTPGPRPSGVEDGLSVLVWANPEAAILNKTTVAARHKLVVALGRQRFAFMALPNEQIPSHRSHFAFIEKGRFHVARDG